MLEILLRLCFLLIGASLAVGGPSKPELYLKVNSKSLDKGLGVGALEPTVRWSTSGTVADYGVDGGLVMSVTDDEAMPYSLWGRIKRTIGDVALSARVDTKSSSVNKLDLDLQAEKGTTAVQIKGMAQDANVSINSVKVKQTLEAPGGGSLTIIPKYNLGTKKSDIKVSYSVGDTTVTVDADEKKQKVTIDQPLGNKVGGGSIRPSITTEGDITLGYSRDLGTGSLSTTYIPNDKISFTYTDGPWTATVTAPMDMDGGLKSFKERLDFSIGRSVDVTGS